MSGIVWVGQGSGPRLGALFVSAVLLGIAARHDRRTHRIPNRLLVAAAAVCAVGATAAGPAQLRDVAWGTLVAGAPMLVVRLTRGIGMGDVKMAAVVGAAGGLVHPLVGPVAVMVMAGTVAAVGAVTGRQRWALGPFLWLAFVGTAALAVARFTGGRA